MILSNRIVQWLVGRFVSSESTTTVSLTGVNLSLWWQVFWVIHMVSGTLCLSESIVALTFWPWERSWVASAFGFDCWFPLVREIFNVFNWNSCGREWINLLLICFAAVQHTNRVHLYWLTDIYDMCPPFIHQRMVNLWKMLFKTITNRKRGRKWLNKKIFKKVSLRYAKPPAS